jgi:chemotaxis protein histidine kinase CheA
MKIQDIFFRTVATAAISILSLVALSMPTNAQQQGEEDQKEQKRVQQEQKQDQRQQQQQQKQQTQQQERVQRQAEQDQKQQQHRAQQEEKQNQRQAQREEQRVSQQQQQELISQQQQRVAQYRKHLDQQERLAQKHGELLQRQKRMAQFRFQEEYIERLRQQHTYLRDHRFDYDRDPYFYTAPIYRYNHGGRYYETNEYGAKTLRQAVNHGYQEGFRAGKADWDDRWRGNYKDSYAYRDVNYGYSGYLRKPDRLQPLLPRGVSSRL